LQHTPSKRLARSTAGGDVHAACALLSTSDSVTRPGPVGARALTAEDVDIKTLSSNSTLDVLDGEASDRDTSSGLAGGATVLVVLLDDDTVLGDVVEGDVLIGDTGDGTGSARDSLDADTVVGVDDSSAGDDDILDGVVGAATNRADGDTMTAGAGTAGEADVSTGVDSQAVVLVLDVGIGDVDTSGAADVKSVGVVAAAVVTSGVVDGDVVEGQLVRAVDGETLDGGVLDVESGDGGRGHGVGVEELHRSVEDQEKLEQPTYLGLRLATVGTLAVPPLGTGTVDNVASGTNDLDVGSRDRDERTLPLLVAECGGTLEGHGGTRLQLRQVQGGSSRNDHVVDDNGSA
jgi:hypothetical protein